MKNLLVIAQMVDENDDHRGFFISWLVGFSKKFDKVFVLTVAKGSYSLPKNVFVYSLGKEQGASKFVQILRFYRYLLKFLPKSCGIFAHASPIFVIASWPVAFILRKKIILWYLHRSVTFRLKLAEKLCYKIVTSTKESLKFFSNKIVETGHGIDVEHFRIKRDWAKEDRLKILSIGRISKIKNYEILLKASKILRNEKIDFEVNIIGQPVMPLDFQYSVFLKSLKSDLNLDGVVKFDGFVPYNIIPNYYREANIFVGLTPDGGVDKALLEGMASGCIVLTSNNATRKYLGPYENELVFDYLNPSDLADKIITLSQLTSEGKEKISNFLVESVSRFHKLDNLISQIYLLL